MHERELKPIWNSSTFLVYTGGLTVLGGAIGAVAYLASQYQGSGARAAWALLILATLYVVAHALLRADRPIAAGIFAFASVIAWAVFVFEVFMWWGWNGVNGSPTSGWSWSRLAFELLVLAAAWDDRRRFRFPFIRLISAIFVWLFLVDLLSSGGNWTYALTLIIGIVYLLAGSVSDKPSAFWVQLVGGALIGVPILHWCHTSDGDFAVVSIMALVFVLWSYWTKRSSWAVYGTIGFFIATVHYLIGSPTALAQGVFGLGGGGCTASSPGALVCAPTTHISAWSFPLAFGLLGFWLVLLGMLGRRRRRGTVEVVVAPAPPAA